MNVINKNGKELNKNQRIIDLFHYYTTAVNRIVKII